MGRANIILNFDKKIKLSKAIREYWDGETVKLPVSHAPAYGVNDGTDLPHRGFQCFHRILEKFRPRYFVHGHMHFSYNHLQKRVTKYGDTIVVNAYERYVIEYP